MTSSVKRAATAAATNLVLVRFDGDELLATRDDAGVWVSVRRVCDALGVDRKNQQEKLSKRAWARVRVLKTPTGSSDGKSYRQVMVHLDSLPMWLATIEPSRVAEHVRPKLERYQLEARDVLAEHFVAQHRAARLPYVLEQMLTTTPQQRARMYGPDAWRTFEALYVGEEAANRLVRPRRCFRAFVHALRIRFLGPEAARRLRELNPEPENQRDYEYFTDAVYDGLKREHLRPLVTIARVAIDMYPHSPGRRLQKFWTETNVLARYKPGAGELDPADPRQLALFDLNADNDNDRGPA